VKGKGVIMNVELIDKFGDQIVCSLFMDAVKKY